MNGATGRSLRDDEGRVDAERIGAYLSRERQLRGVTLEELARQTRIPLRSLQRLESGAFDRDPDGFARGFVRTVAVALGLPADETIARMLPETDADDDSSAPHPLSRVVQALALAVVLGAVAGSLWMWIASSAGEAVAPIFQARADGLVVRRDAVRALAEEHGLLTGPAAGTFLPGAEATPPPAAADPQVAHPEVVEGGDAGADTTSGR
jgi:transcriptional regulator with XRE-family HTH domain